MDPYVAKALERAEAAGLPAGYRVSGWSAAGPWTWYGPGGSTGSGFPTRHRAANAAGLHYLNLSAGSRFFADLEQDAKTWTCEWCGNASRSAEDYSTHQAACPDRASAPPELTKCAPAREAEAKPWLGPAVARSALLDAAENVSIAYGMGWDLAGVMAVLTEAVAAVAHDRSAFACAS